MVVARKSANSARGPVAQGVMTPALDGAITSRDNDESSDDDVIVNEISQPVFDDDNDAQDVQCAQEADVTSEQAFDINDQEAPCGQADVDDEDFGGCEEEARSENELERGQDDAARDEDEESTQEDDDDEDLIMYEIDVADWEKEAADPEHYKAKRLLMAEGFPARNDQNSAAEAEKEDEQEEEDEDEEIIMEEIEMPYDDDDDDEEKLIMEEVDMPCDDEANDDVEIEHIGELDREAIRAFSEVVGTEFKEEPTIEVVKYEKDVVHFLAGGYREFIPLFNEESDQKEEHVPSDDDNDDEDDHWPVEASPCSTFSRAQLSQLTPFAFASMRAKRAPILISGFLAAADIRQSSWALDTFANLLGQERIVSLRLTDDDSRAHVTAGNYAEWLKQPERSPATACCVVDSLVGSCAGLQIERHMAAMQQRTGLRADEACVGMLQMHWAPRGHVERDDEGRRARTLAMLSGTFQARAFLGEHAGEMLEVDVCPGDCLFVPSGWRVDLEHKNPEVERAGHEHLLWVTKWWHTDDDAEHKSDSK